jgi:hypothetical protein
MFPASGRVLFISPGGPAPPRQVSNKVMKIGCEHLQIMLCPFLHTQQMLVSVAPATAPTFGEHVCCASRLQWSRPSRHLSKRGTISMISRFHTAAQHAINDETNFSHVVDLLGCSLKRCFC